LLNCRPEIGAANFRLIAANRAECAYLFFFVYGAHQPVDDTAFPAK
jgi:hypothetical protein